MTAASARDTDLARLKLVSDPRLARDGHLAFVQSWPDPDADAIRREVMVLAPGSEQPQRLAPAGVDAWCPRWSPAGPELAVISAAGGKPQPAVGRPGQPGLRPLVTVPGAAVELEWSPDGRALAVTCVQLETLTGDPSLVQPSGPARLDGQAGLVTQRRRIFVVAADGAADAAVRDVLAGPGGAWHPRWSPDGTRLAFLASLPDAAGVAGPARLCVAGLAGSGEAGQLTQLAAHAAAVAWSPSGRELAFLGADDVAQSDLESRLFRCGADGTAPATELASDWDRSLGSTVKSDDERGTGSPVLLWSAVTDRVYFPVADGGQGQIGWAAAHGSERGVLLTGKRACLDPSLDPAGCAMAFVSSDPADPGEIWLAGLDGRRERRLTDVNGWLRGLQLTPARLVTASAADGTAIEGWLTVPAAAAAGPPCPLVVSVHGGPHYPAGWRFSAETQRLAARGYAVLTGNPRGSGGYGRGFAAAIRGAWGTCDWSDVSALIDAATLEPGVDGGRIAVTGVSYGGYLAMRAITLTGRFMAAISENGISNLAALWGSGAEDPGWLSRELGGTPWERPDDYLAAAPLTHAGQIRTPLLLIHAELDQNCPISQSEQMLAALRYRGAPAELIRLAGEGHLVNLVGRPSRRQARALAVDRWLDRYLRAGQRQDPSSPGDDAGKPGDQEGNGHDDRA